MWRRGSPSNLLIIVLFLGRYDLTFLLCTPSYTPEHLKNCKLVQLSFEIDDPPPKRGVTGSIPVQGAIFNGIQTTCGFSDTNFCTRHTSATQ